MKMHMYFRCGFRNVFCDVVDTFAEDIFPAVEQMKRIRIRFTYTMTDW